MCIDYTRKYTLCGCTWDEAHERCVPRRWCKRPKLVHKECDKMCDVCWLEVYRGVEELVEKGFGLESWLLEGLRALRGGSEGLSTQKTLYDLSRVCDPVPMGKRKVKRRVWSIK